MKLSKRSKRYIKRRSMICNNKNYYYTLGFILRNKRSSCLGEFPKTWYTTSIYGSYDIRFWWINTIIKDRDGFRLKS